MEHNDSFSLVGCIEKIIYVFSDNIEFIAMVELLIIIALVLVYLAKTNQLKDENNNLFKCLKEEQKKYLKSCQDWVQQKKALEMALQAQMKKTPNDGKKTADLPLTPSSSKSGTQSDLPNEAVGIIGQSDAMPISHDSEQNDVEPENHREYQYLELPNKGKFLKMKVTDDKCFFRTWIEDNVRKYEFWGNTAKALANLNATFDDSCDYEGKQNGATEIINVEPGILSDDLTITTKAKIRLQ